MISGEFDLVQLVFEFPPGAATPVHTHGGAGLLTVLEGRIALRDEDKPERLFNPGDSWVEGPGVYGAAANVGSGTTRLLAGFLLPKGAPLTTPKQQPSASPVGMPRTGAGGLRDPVLLVLFTGLLLLVLGGLTYLSQPAKR
jgi:quercetin dioxygenase-like cupin family protein